MILKVENGHFAYKGGPEILSGVNFAVRPGEIMAVLGPNGAGKTTLLRCMMDMLRWTEGSSTLDGEDIHSIPARKLWRRMAYVPQAKSAASSYTAFQTVILGRSSRIGSFSAPSHEDMDIAEQVMTQLGIMDLADKPCYAVSGGELQMILIARAMAAEPEILVLDEPESNLDFRNQLIVLDTMSELAARGMACVFNTHYPAHALQRADTSLLLTKGGEALFGSTSQVVTEDNIRKAFGVNAVIGEIETPESILRNVVPVSIGGREDAEESIDTEAEMPAGLDGETCVASVTIISATNEAADRINTVLHEYSSRMAGRMGLPYRKAGLYIINITLDAPRAEIEEMTHRLQLIPGISIKTTYARM